MDSRFLSYDTGFIGKGAQRDHSAQLQAGREKRRAGQRTWREANLSTLAAPRNRQVLSGGHRVRHTKSTKCFRSAKDALTTAKRTTAENAVAGHLRAWPPKKRVQELRRLVHLRARANKKRMQELRRLGQWSSVSTTITEAHTRAEAAAPSASTGTEEATARAAVANFSACTSAEEATARPVRPRPQAHHDAS